MKRPADGLPASTGSITPDFFRTSLTIDDYDFCSWCGGMLDATAVVASLTDPDPHSPGTVTVRVGVFHRGCIHVASPGPHLN